MQSDTSFKDVLQEYIDIKSTGLKKISENTGVPIRYLEAMLENNIESLPPSPYVRGYITKLAEELEFDREEMWRLYKREIAFTGSGPTDRLPSNRFAVKKFNKKLVITVAITLLLFIYVIWNFNKLFGATALELTYPTTENVIVNEPAISIEGRTDTSSKLTINGEEVFVDEDGRFQKIITLNEGLNSVEIASKRFLGKENTVNRKVIYQKPQKNEVDKATSINNDN